MNTIFLSKLGNVGSKSRSQGQIKGNLVNTLEVTFLTWFSSNLVKIFISRNTRFLSKLGHVGSKSMSWGQTKGKTCEHYCKTVMERHFKIGLANCFHTLSTVWHVLHNVCWTYFYTEEENRKRTSKSHFDGGRQDPSGISCYQVLGTRSLKFNRTISQDFAPKSDMWSNLKLIFINSSN